MKAPMPPMAMPPFQDELVIFYERFTSQLDDGNMESHLTHAHTWGDFGGQIFSTEEGQQILIQSFDQDGDGQVRY